MEEEDQHHRLTLRVKWRKIADTLVTNTAQTGQDQAGPGKGQGHKTEIGGDHVTGTDPGKEVADQGHTTGDGLDQGTDMTETEEDREAKKEGQYTFSSFLGWHLAMMYLFPKT